ncbi:MAG: Uncharacterised protein [Prochlorococcus marinus str. MIT 9215]|nr:MAG: Uncharacterised protein [Prochlorococcus marinus str. MIT 9215]
MLPIGISPFGSVNAMADVIRPARLLSFADEPGMIKFLPAGIG